MAYPASITTLIDKTDGPDQIIYAAHINAIHTALRDLNTILGNAPQGNKTAIEDRLDIRIDDDGNLKNPQQLVTVGKSNADYTTITAALAAITDAASDKIYTVLVYPGIYTEAVTLKNYVNIIAVDKNSSQIKNGITDGGAEVNSVVSIKIKPPGAIGVQTTHANSNMTILNDIISTGNLCARCTAGTQTIYGNCINTGSSFSAVECSGGTQTIYGNCSAKGDTTVNCTGGTQTIYGNCSNTLIAKAVACGSTGIQTIYGNCSAIGAIGAQCYSGTQTIYGNCSSTNSVGAKCQDGTQTINGDCTSTGATGALCSGGTQTINGNCTGKSNTYGAAGITGGTQIIRNAKIYSTLNESNGHAYAIKGNGVPILHNCRLICTHADAYAIYASVARNITCMSVWANRDDHANITQLIADGFIFNANVQ